MQSLELSRGLFLLPDMILHSQLLRSLTQQLAIPRVESKIKITVFPRIVLNTLSCRISRTSRDSCILEEATMNDVRYREVPQAL